ncbi:MAG: TonB-dependent receptor, partial [Pseudomonadota bacterium]
THFAVPNLGAPPGPFGPTFVANLFVGNANLSPERSDTYEVGAGLDLDSVLFDGDTFTVKGSYYNSEVDDLIGLDVNIPGGCFVPMLAVFEPCGTGPEFNNISQNINIANAEIEGVEVELSYDSDYAYLRGNLTTIDGVDEDSGEFLEGTLVPNTVFLDGGVKIQSIGLRIGGRLTIADDFTEVNDPLEVRDDFVVGDIYAVWQPQFAGLDGIRLDLGIDNVADTDFEVVSAGVSQPGRNYKVALSYSYGF